MKLNKIIRQILVVCIFSMLGVIIGEYVATFKNEPEKPVCYKFYNEIGEVIFRGEFGVVLRTTTDNKKFIEEYHINKYIENYYTRIDCFSRDYL